MIRRDASYPPDPAGAVARWHRTLGMLADNDNVPRSARGGAMVAVLGLPLASAAALAACIRFLT